jgi:hypothetical protein
MTSGTLDDRYLLWLYKQVRTVKTTRKGPRTYWNLLGQLFATEFVWFVPNDDNRAADGRELRNEWANGIGEEVDSNWLDLGCSFLEMLIGLSRRLAFETDHGDDGASWFWHLINNLGLLGYTDGSKFRPEDVDEITSRVIWRTYDQSGHGGLFPLEHTNNDQREVEIWYQLSEYLLQNS